MRIMSNEVFNNVLAYYCFVDKKTTNLFAGAKQTEFVVSFLLCHSGYYPSLSDLTNVSY